MNLAWWELESANLFRGTETPFGLLPGLSHDRLSPGAWSMGKALRNIFWTNRRNQKQVKEGTEMIRGRTNMGKIDCNKGQLYINHWLVSTSLCTNLHVSLFPRQGPPFRVRTCVLGCKSQQLEWDHWSQWPMCLSATSCCDYRHVNEHEPQELQARGANQEVTWEQGRGCLRVTHRS